jgi:tetratricopeptide (TPR) repeat protein
VDRLETSSRRAEERPEDPAAWLAMADALIEVGAVDPARYVLQRARACDPASAEQWFELGRLLHRIDDRPSALEALRAATVLDPAHRASVILFARTAVDEGQLDEAKDVLAKSLELREEPEVRHLLALVDGREAGDVPATPPPGFESGEHRAAGLTGDLAVFKLEEILEFLGVQRATGEIHIVGGEGDAVVELGEGRILDVRYPDQRSLEADLGLDQLGRPLDGPSLRALADEGKVSWIRIETGMRDRIEAGMARLLEWTEGQIHFEKKPMSTPITPGFDHQGILMSVMKAIDEKDR